MSKVKMNWLRAVLAICVILCFSIGLVACKGSLEILDWQDETVEVTLGESYTVPEKIAKDKNGNVYPVTVKVVKKSTGGEIPLIYGAFDVFDIDGYDVIYTASSDDAQAVKTVTLTVKDSGRPVVKIQGNGVAEVGKRFTFPEISVYDDSGKATLTTAVFDGEENQVESDDGGFTPSAIGEYELRVTAKDDDGNEGNAVFSIYARTQIKENEIESFDDGGLSRTAYSQGRTGSDAQGEKQSAVFTTFKKSTGSSGSAMFQSGAGKSTGLYLSPRIEAEVLNEENCDYLAVWLFIADGTGAEHKVVFGTGTATVPAGVWREIRVSSEETGNMTRWFYNLRQGLTPFITVENGEMPFKIYIDDIYAVKTAENLLTGVQSQYAVNDEVSFTAADGVKTELYYYGDVQNTESGKALERAGEYTLFASAGDGKTTEAYRFTVGTLTVDAVSDAWLVVNKKSRLPVAQIKDDGTEAEGEIVYYLVDFKNGEKTKVEGNTVRVNSDAVAILLEGECGGVTTANLVFPTVSKYQKNTIQDFSNPKSASGFGANGEWLEEYKGSEGVTRLFSDGAFPTNAQGAGSSWAPVFNAGNYASYSHVTFEFYGEGVENLNEFMYCVENAEEDPTQDDGYRNHDISLKKGLVNGYNRVSVPMSEFLPYYDFYTVYPYFWIGSRGAFSLWFDSITATNELALTGQKAEVMFGEYAFEDDALSVFGANGCVAGDVERTVYSNDGIVALDGDKLTVEGGKVYTVVYYATAPDGTDYSASYSFTGLSSIELKVTDKAIAYFAGEITIDDNSAEIFAGFTGLTCTVTCGGEPVTLDGNRFIAEAGKTYTVTYNATGTDGNPYTASYSFKVNREEDRFTFYNLNEQADLGGHQGDITFLETFGGKQGVMKISDAGNEWMWLFRDGVSPMFDKKYYEQFDSIAFRVRALNASGEGGRFTLMIMAETVRDWNQPDNPIIHQGYDLSAQITVTDNGDWQDVQIPIALFLEHWDDAVARFMVWNVKNGTDNADLYISDITVCMSAEVVNNVSEAFEGNVTLSDNHESVFGAKGAVGEITRTVTCNGAPLAVDGNTLAVEAGKLYAVTYYATDVAGRPIRGGYTFRGISAIELSIRNQGAPIEGSYTIKDTHAEVFDGYTGLNRVVTCDGESVALTGDTLTLEAGKTYTVTYNATGTDGKPYTASYSFTAYSAADRNTFYRFETASDLGNNCNSNVTLLDEYEGKQGVIQIKGTGEDWQAAFRGTAPLFPKEYYGGFDYLVLTLRTNRSFTFNILTEAIWTEPAVPSIYLSEQHITVTNTEAWQEVLLPFAQFRNNWDAFVERFMFYNNNQEGDFLYIAEMRVGKSVTVTNNLTSPVFSGKVQLSDNSANAFANYTGLTRKVICDGAEITLDNVNSFNAEANKTYVVTYSAKDSDGYDAYASYSFTVRDVSQAGMVFDFSTEAGIGNYNKDCAEYLDNFKGETGVCKFTKESNKSPSDWQTVWCFHNVKPLFDQTYYNQFDFIVFRIYSTQAAWVNMSIENVADSQFMEVQTNGLGWADYYVNISAFRSDTVFKGFGNSVYLSTHAQSLWISRIYAVKRAEITLSGGGLGNQEVGKEIALSDNAETVMSGAERTVLTPSGEVKITDGKFTPNEEGLYTVIYKKVDGRGILEQGSYEIKAYNAGRIWSYKSDGDLEGRKLSENKDDGVVYLSEYDGKKDVIKFFSASTQEFAWIFRGQSTVFAKDHYSGFDKIRMTVKSNLAQRIGLFHETNWNGFVVGTIGSDQINTWVTFEVNAADFLNSFDDFTTSLYFWSPDQNANSEMYISEIVFFNSQT